MHSRTGSIAVLAFMGLLVISCVLVALFLGYIHGWLHPAAPAEWAEMIPAFVSSPLGIIYALFWAIMLVDVLRHGSLGWLFVVMAVPLGPIVYYCSQYEYSYKKKRTVLILLVIVLALLGVALLLQPHSKHYRNYSLD